MRITRPLIGTAVGAGVLGASLGLGLTMASASTSSTGTAGTSHSASSTTSVSATATPTASKPSGHPGSSTTHKCTHMSGGGQPSGSTSGS